MVLSQQLIALTRRELVANITLGWVSLSEVGITLEGIHLLRV